MEVEELRDDFAKFSYFASSAGNYGKMGSRLDDSPPPLPPLPRRVVRKRHSRKKKMHYVATIRSRWLNEEVTYSLESAYPSVDIRKDCEHIETN